LGEHVAESKRPFYNAVARLVELRTGRDLTEEHGFNTTTVVIKVVVATTPREEAPAGGAKVEVYVPSGRGFYRSLVYEGVADRKGVVKLNVISGRDYIVFAQLNPLFGFEYVGAEYIYIPPGDKVVNITLKVYPKG